MGKSNNLGLMPICRFLFVLLVFIVINENSFAGERQQNDSLSSILPFIYVLCPYCDMDYIKKEVTFANFTNHPSDADIKILITSQDIGSGGKIYTIHFEGNEKYGNLKDTLKYIRELNEQEADYRKGIMKRIELGLLQYLKNSPLADGITISFEKSGNERMETTDDNWDSWVFSIYGNSYMSGEKSSNYANFGLNAGAERITESLKINFNAGLDYSESNYDYEDTKFKSVYRSIDIGSHAIFSIDSNFSAGLFGSLNRSTYSNTDFAARISAGAEYNFYPYSVSTSRYFSIIYKLGYLFNKYFEETIYDKLNERLLSQSVQAYYMIKETWGTISTSLTFSNYLNDFSKRRVNIYSGLSLYIVGGLSFDFWGSFSMINDQIYLVKGSISREDLLLKRKAIRTDYSYYFSLGLSYTFGAKYNNVVNPRFRD